MTHKLDSMHCVGEEWSQCPGSHTFSVYMDQFVLQANRTALDSLQSFDFPKAWSSLKSAESCLSSQEAEQLPNRLQLLALTYNNFSCYFKRKNRLPEALRCLSYALTLETTNAETPTAIAATHLNISAVYSEMKGHEKALEHAEFALDLLGRYAGNGSEGANLVIACYNVAAEMEHLGRRRESLEMYSKGVETAYKHLGADHPLTSKIRTALEVLLSKGRRPKLALHTSSPVSDSRPFTHSSSRLTKSSLSPSKSAFKSYLPRRHTPTYKPIFSIQRKGSRPGYQLHAPSVPESLSTVRRIQSLLMTKSALHV